MAISCTGSGLPLSEARPASKVVPPPDLPPFPSACFAFDVALGLDVGDGAAVADSVASAVGSGSGWSSVAPFVPGATNPAAGSAAVFGRIGKAAPPTVCCAGGEVESTGTGFVGVTGAGLSTGGVTTGGIPTGGTSTIGDGSTGDGSTTGGSGSTTTGGRGSTAGGVVVPSTGVSVGASTTPVPGSEEPSPSTAMAGDVKNSIMATARTMQAQVRIRPTGPAFRLPMIPPNDCKSILAVLFRGRLPAVVVRVQVL